MPIADSRSAQWERLTNTSICGALAQATNGAVVVLEHRFYGESNPLPDHTVQSLSLHTVDQALDDLVYFAQNFKSSMPGGDASGVLPRNTPWIFVGVSYAGALGPWLLEQRPGVFWAAYSSSGVIHPQVDFHQYWDVVQEHMPANCSADFRAITERIDSLIDAKDGVGLSELKTIFGFPKARDLDLVYALSTLMGDWQLLDISPTRSQSSNFFSVCDALETAGNGTVSTNAEGWGFDVASQNLARYVSGSSGYFDWLYRAVGATSVDDCTLLNGKRRASVISTGDTSRLWFWQICSEMGWAQIGPAEGGGLISKHYRAEDIARYCQDAFPGAFLSGTLAAYESRVRETAQKFRGYETSAKRVFVVNGRRDPWLGVTLSSPEVPPGITITM